MKSAGNAVIPTFPTHWSHGLQHLRHKRRNVRFEGLRRVHTCLRQQDRTQRLTRRNTGVSDGGWYHYPRSVPHVSETLRGRGIRTAYFAALGSWPGGALEERRKPSGQRCAYACRCPEGVAAPLGCVIFLQFGDVAVFSLCTQYFTQNFLRVQDEGGITTLVLLRVLLKRWTAACQKGSFAAFCDEICQG